MSFPTYEDINKQVVDTLKDDFDTKTKFALKIKADAPYGVKVTQSSEFNGGAVAGKFSAKGSFGSMNVDKFEVKSCGSIVTETSLQNVAPGLKFDFKGDDKKKGKLGLEYTHEHATITTNLDLVKFSEIEASLTTGANGVNIGAAAVVSLGDKTDLSSINVAASYKLPNKTFLGLQTAEKFTKFTGFFSHQGVPKYDFFGKVNFTPADKSHSFEVGTAYGCCKGTSMKAKVDNNGDLSFALKQSLSNKTSFVGAVKANPKDFSKFTFGLNLTIG